MSCAMRAPPDRCAAQKQVRAQGFLQGKNNGHYSYVINPYQLLSLINTAAAERNSRSFIINRLNTLYFGTLTHL